MTKTIRNAKIEEVFLGIEDHGCMTFYITLDFGDGQRQNFGGYALDNGGYPIIRKILEVVGVSSISRLVGQIVRADGDMWKVNAIGNCLKEEWLNPEEYFKQHTNEK